MNSPVALIIYLDIFVFIGLIAFFITLFKSGSIFSNKKSSGRI